MRHLGFANPLILEAGMYAACMGPTFLSPLGSFMKSATRIAFCSISLALSPLSYAVPITFSVGGDGNASSIQATVDAFRAALGSPNNGNAAGPLASGRREINWDGGGGVSTTTVSGTPLATFLDTRGAQFTTPGTGFAQATPDGLGTQFGNATYATTFGTFSALRLFVPIGSNVTDGVFFLPGSNGLVPATVNGFGAAFSDVDLANTTSISFFDAQSNLLYSASVPAGSVSTGSLSFLGVLFDAGERVARVRLTTGNSALGLNDGAGVDVVAMDDFIYGEPRTERSAVPEPTMVSLLGVSLVALVAARRRRRA